MNKSKTNFIIDALLFLGMMFLTGTGFVRKYILLGGSASREVYGRKMNMFMLGYDRDTWSTIHLFTGYLILILLFLHIILHWKQIKIMYKQLIDHSAARWVILVVFVIFSVLLAIFPFLLTPSMIPG